MQRGHLYQVSIHKYVALSHSALLLFGTVTKRHICTCDGEAVVQTVDLLICWVSSTSKSVAATICYARQQLCFSSSLVLVVDGTRPCFARGAQKPVSCSRSTM
ncbi:uncharacterized protein UV8b_07833 [Ustilaginoidea virens]|uniref:Uncharacterized protein n=1 Tax=Ustilaginoidea virens TaxID=1159556 RepID=A0A8E5HY29_USTVR|nr:uncharacterized protein UV8b_07833 [Ustilaginoidea virens]QUC23592.1 hypothetical protein UV8b_07833 [Ustilaginoidea virens]